MPSKRGSVCTPTGSHRLERHLELRNGVDSADSPELQGSHFIVDY